MTRRKRGGGRLKQPEEGEECVNGHLNWVQYSDGLWYCRTCRTESNRAWRKHARLTNGDRVRKVDRERRRRYFEKYPEKKAETSKRRAEQERARRKKKREE